MTREEQKENLDWLRRLRSEIYVYMPVEWIAPMHIALDAAIQALEQEPFINKPCVSAGVCEHDKQKVLDKLRAEIEPTTKNDLADGKDNNVTSKITREEVIEQLQDAKIGYKEYLSNDALDMAISALEHPERNVVAIVPCGDAISRQEAIDTIRQLYLDLASQKAVIDILKVLPSVTPQEPRKVHWEHGRELSRVFIGDALRGINYEDWHCSNCHCVIEQSIKPKWNYCPNCGADMREVEV